MVGFQCIFIVLTLTYFCGLQAKELRDTKLSAEEQILVDLEETLRLKNAAVKDEKAFLELKKDEGLPEVIKTVEKGTAKKKEVVKTIDKAETKKDQEEDVLEDLRKLLAGFIQKKELQFHEERNQIKKSVKQQDETDEAIKELLSLLGNTKKDDDTDLPTKKEAENGKRSVKTELTLKDVLKAVNDAHKREEKCEDVMNANDCYRLAYNGSCAVYPKEMSKRCKRSCRFCCADSKIGICKVIAALKNYRDTCVSKNLHERLRIMCPKTCGFCGKALSEAPCVRSDYGCCWEGSIAKNHVGTENDGCPGCKNLNSESFCERFKSDCDEDYTLAGEQIRLMCPKTCRRCGPHAKCRDDPKVADTCVMMKHQGGCKNIFHAMKFSCAKTCGICKTSTIECKDTKYGCCADGKTIASGVFKDGCPECADKPNTKYNCGYLQKHHACTSHKKIMKKFCAGTCQSCLKND